MASKSKPSTPEPKRSADAAVKIVERIKQAIYAGEFPPGTALREKRLSLDWNVGMTPVREAVRLLAAKGFLVLRPNQAPLVRKIDVEEIRQIYEVRELLEVEALRRAWTRIKPSEVQKVGRYFQLSEARKRANYFKFDDSFHGLWIQNCGNKWLTEAIENLMIYRPTYGHLFAQHLVFVNKAIEDHRRIYEALCGGHLEAACEALGSHISSNVVALEHVFASADDASLPAHSPVRKRTANRSKAARS